MKLKFSILIGLLVILLIFIIGYSLINYLKDKLTEEVLKRGTQLIRNFSTVALENYTTGDEFPIIVYCANLLKEEGIKEVFFITKDGYVVAHSDNKKITPEPGRDIKGTSFAKQFKPSSFYNKPFFFKGKELEEKLFGYQFYLDEKYYDIYAPVKHKNKYFGDVHIIFSRDIIFKSNKQAKNRVLYIALITIVLGLAGALGLSSSIVKPIKKLAKGVQAIGMGDLDYKIAIKSKDEIGFLASEFNDMTVKLKEAQKVMVAQQRMEQEMEIASEIQKMLLPEKLPEYNNLEITAFYQPANKVGGDYYDFIKITDNKLGIIVADVSGKNVSGSLGMTMFRSIFHSIMKPDLDAYNTLCIINKLMQPDIPDGMFITAFYGILDVKEYTLDYANAGHDPLVISNGETKNFNLYEADGTPVGIMEPAMFDEMLKKRELSLKKNDIIVQYSDGVIEGMDQEKKQFGEERFHDSIKRNSHLPAQQLVEAIKKDLFAFTKGAKQNDDITLIAVKLI